jgi:hypothetical protein
MNRHMLCPCQRHQVLRAIVKGVAVDVVDHQPSRPWPVHRFPHDDGTLSPHVRLGHLDPRPRIAATLVTHTRRHGTNGKQVGRPCAAHKLGRWRSLFALVDAVELVVQLRGAPDRTAIGGTDFGRLPGEWRGADGACEVDRHTPIIPSFGGTGTTGAVAHLRGRDATLIDIDERNAAMYPARLDECRRTLFGVKPELPGQEALFG